jgi:hypothetical protein
LNSSISGCVIDKVSGEPLNSPRLAIHRLGVVGETFVSIDEKGFFTFPSLEAGNYSLSAYDDAYVSWHGRITLNEGHIINDLQVALTRGGFIAGCILDERRRPPQRCVLTLLREGQRGGQSGYINDSGDHPVSEDGIFRSPALSSGTYLLRFAGILQKSAPPDAPAQGGLTADRVFDFLYPNAQDVSGADGFAVGEGQTLSGLQIQIPNPIRYRLHGRVIGTLPRDRSHISLQFRRDMGAVDQVGWAGGATLRDDGTFEGLEQSGRYLAEIFEFAPPEPSGRTHLIRTLGNTTFTVGCEDLSGIEIHVQADVHDT